MTAKPLKRHLNGFKLKKRSLDSFAASKKLMTDSFNTSFETQLENERNLLSFVAGQPNGAKG
jgi:hypothetical protein